MEKTMGRLSSDLSELFHCQARAVKEEEFESQSCGFADSLVCKNCRHQFRRDLRTHQYGVRESLRWGGSYIYYCPNGLTFCAFMAKGENKKSSGVIFGPVILGEHEDLLLDGASDGFIQQIQGLTELSPERLGSLSGVGSMAVCGVAHSKNEENQTYDQSEFLNELYIMREKFPQNDRDDYGYIVRAENDMESLIKNMDKPGAQKLLNNLLGRVYLQSYYNLEEVKVRCVELVVLLSRSVINAGVEMGRVFSFNREFVQQIQSVLTIDDLCAWTSDILHEFIDALFSYSGIKHADAVYKTMHYIRNNWKDKPALDDVAKYVYLSKSYLSMLFKQETGIGISEFTNQVRIEHSKKLLSTTDMSIASIAGECCFHDQSYYTKVFQKMVGVSPKKYRDKNIDFQE